MQSGPPRPLVCLGVSRARHSSTSSLPHRLWFCDGTRLAPCVLPGECALFSTAQRESVTLHRHGRTFYVSQSPQALMCHCDHRHIVLVINGYRVPFMGLRMMEIRNPTPRHDLMELVTGSLRRVSVSRTGRFASNGSRLYLTGVGFGEGLSLRRIRPGAL